MKMMILSCMIVSLCMAYVSAEEGSGPEADDGVVILAAKPDPKTGLTLMMTREVVELGADEGEHARRQMVVLELMRVSSVAERDDDRTVLWRKVYPEPESGIVAGHEVVDWTYEVDGETYWLIVANSHYNGARALAIPSDNDLSIDPGEDDRRGAVDGVGGPIPDELVHKSKWLTGARAVDVACLPNGRLFVRVYPHGDETVTYTLNMMDGRWGSGLDGDS